MAILTVPISVLKLSSSIGTTLTNDCANSQNVITLKTIPINNLLLPSNASLRLFHLYLPPYTFQNNSITEICLFDRIIEWFLILMCKTLSLLVVHPFILKMPVILPYAAFCFFL